MHNHEFGPVGSPGIHEGHDGAEGAGGHSILSLVLLIAAVVVTAIVGLTVAFWALGFLFDIAGLVLRVALLAAVAAFVWRRVVRGRPRKYDY
jgi:hypothetical protein